jgi:hypothetical protein
MLAKLGVHDRCQQVGAGTAAGYRMERRGRLRNRLARAAREFLPHRLDHLIAARDALEALGNGLAEFGQHAAAARTLRRRWQHHALARQMRRQRRPYRLGAPERAHRRHLRRIGRSRRFVLRGGSLGFLELHLQLIEQLAAALRGRIEAITLQLGNQQLEMRHHCFGPGGAGLRLAAGRALGQQRNPQRLNVLGNRLRRIGHAGIESRCACRCTRIVGAGQS